MGTAATQWDTRLTTEGLKLNPKILDPHENRNGGELPPKNLARGVDVDKIAQVKGAYMMAKKDQTDYTQRPYRLTPILLDAFEQAKRKKYLISRRHKLTEAWQHYCALQRMPCIIIKPRGNRTTVTMDIVLCDFVLSEEHLDLISKATHEASETEAEADITVGLDFYKLNNVLLEQAEPLAVNLLKIAEKARKGNKTSLTTQARNHIG